MIVLFQLKVIMSHHTRTIAALCLAWGVSVSMSTASSVDCHPPRTSTVNVVLRSERNRTGHWLTQVDYEQADSLGSLDAQNTGRVIVEVQHIRTTASCNSAPSVVIRTTITVPPLPPGPNYELFPGIGYYKLHTSTTMWARARETCAEEGTHLAIINSQREADVLKELLSRVLKFVNSTSNDYAYVGFHDHDIEGHFVTIFGDPLTKTGYLQWHGLEPTGTPENNENCGLMHRDGKLADVTCNWVMPFICEQELY